jgi:hypothetical protein
LKRQMKKLTSYQKKSLEFYLAHKDRQITFLSMYRFNAKLYAWIGILILGVTFFYYFLGGLQAAGIVFALFMGMLARDIGTFWKSIRNWPVLQEIIDWDKATSIMESAEDRKIIP